MKRVRAVGILLAAAVFAAVAPVVRADRVTTTSGQTFVGVITEQNDQNVVIKTMSGMIAVPTGAVQSIERDDAGESPRIVVETIDPSKASEAFAEAREAVGAGEWVRAGSLLEGLLALDAAAFPHENRLAATAALTTCYLQTKDPEGAARSFVRRAELAMMESDKKRLLATAEALREAQSTVIGETSVSRYDEAIAAAMAWKAEQLAGLAKDACTKAVDLDKMERLERAAKIALERLGEADLYVPGYGADAKRRQEVLDGLAGNVVDGATRAVEICTEQRKELSRYWKMSAASIKHAQRWNDLAIVYLTMRQSAVAAIENLERLAAAQQMPELYSGREKEFKGLLEQLDDLQYHLQEPGMKKRYKICLRKFGGML